MKKEGADQSSTTYEYSSKSGREDGPRYELHLYGIKIQNTNKCIIAVAHLALTTLRCCCWMEFIVQVSRHLLYYPGERRQAKRKKEQNSSSLWLRGSSAALPPVRIALGPAEIEAVPAAEKRTTKL